MIRHIVFFTVRDKAAVGHVAGLLEGLGGIGAARVFEVSRNLATDPIANEIDIVIYAEFAGEAELAAYRAHPVYAEITRKVRPLREMRIAADVLSSP